MFCNVRVASLIMRGLRKTINITLWTLVAAYFAAIVALKLPPVQNMIGRWISDAVSNKINSKVEIGNINLGFFNRVIIDNVKIYDQEDSLMIASSRLSVSIDLLKAVKGNVSISSAQVFGLRAYLSKKNNDAPFNFQFALDSLASKDKQEETELNLHIGSLIIRNGLVCYDQKDYPTNTEKFSHKHLRVSDISSHIILNKITQDSININIKKLSLKEKSGIKISNLSLEAMVTKNNAVIKQFDLKMPNSHIVLEETKARYKTDGKTSIFKTLDFNTTVGKSYISPADVAAFLPNFSSAVSPIDFSMKINGHGENIFIKSLAIKDRGGEMSLFANGYIYDISSLKEWLADIKYFRINKNYIENFAKMLKGGNFALPKFLDGLGDFGYTGTVLNRNNKTSVKGKLTSNIGNVAINGSYGNDDFAAKIRTDGFDIGKLSANNDLGEISTSIDIKGKMRKGKTPDIIAKGNFSQIFFKGYKYRNIEIDGRMISDIFNGKLSIDDPNVSLYVEGELSRSHATDITLNIKNINPNALGLTEKWKGTTFCGKLKGDFHGSSLDDAVGNLSIEDFKMSNNTDSVFKLNNITLSCGGKPTDRHLRLYGDFGHVSLDGQYKVSSLPYVIAKIVKSRLPSMPGLSKTNMRNTDCFTIDAKISDASILRKFMNFPIMTRQPIIIEGNINQTEEHADITLTAKDILYSDAPYKNIYLNISTSKDEALNTNISIDKVMANGHTIALGVTSSAINDRMISSISWDNNGKKRFSGSLNTDATFTENENGKATADIDILHSNIIVGDTVWNITPSNIKYSNDRLAINNFSVNHGRQHINIDGTATRSKNDSIMVSLQDVNVKYVLDMLNFHSVDFDGYASGRAKMSSLFGQPELHGDISVRNFIFEEGHIGTLQAFFEYDNTAKQININARADDGPLCRTIIGGYVSPARKELDLNIKAIGTSAEFMEGLCSSFLDNVRAAVNGDVHIFGPLKAINIEGNINVDGEIKLPALNTNYALRNCNIVMRPNILIFENDTITDRDGNMAEVNGTVRHQNLSKWTYDLGIKAENLLSYDFHDFGENTFFGTVYATGTCNIHGKNGETVFDIDITPQRGTFFEYNAAAPEAISNTDFIEWAERDSDKQKEEEESKKKKNNNNFRSDLKMNFRINATTDAALKLLMDKNTGDMITLYGNGNLRAIYHNKAGFNMYGNYEISHGTYGMTIQNVIKKDFTFKSGGSIVFGGDPYNAAINMKAKYTVNGVPLSDLHIGRSFANNNVRVDCIMNITGTPNVPRIDFDFDMPTVNEDANQMVRSLINSEEELNQQVIYLLSIGRFYSQANSASLNSQQSQTSLAMQSLLSGTITQQINSVLSNVVNNSNWNFGANISTGDEGFNNAEYEGTLSGRLLNNRLLINGQFGYRDNENATTSFIGDFDIHYLLVPNGNIAVRIYNQTNDRYFTRNSLTTQGVGLVLQKDFTTLSDLFGIKKRKDKKK